MSIPVGGTELYLNRAEASYLQELLTVFGIKEIQAAVSLVNRPVQERTQNLYSFMSMNITMKNLMRNVQDKGGAIWLMPQAIEHIVGAINLFDPDGMPSDLVTSHIHCAGDILERLIPQMTLVSNLVSRWEESPLTTKTDKVD